MVRVSSRWRLQPTMRVGLVCQSRPGRALRRRPGSLACTLTGVPGDLNRPSFRVRSPRWFSERINGGDGLWPDSAFPQVDAGPVRDELIAHQTMARVVREGRGRLQLSARALARVAGVDRDVVRRIEDGAGTVELSNAVKVLTAVGAMVVAMPKSPEARRRARQQAEAEMEQPGGPA